MPKNLFRFKKFDISQDLCAMKVGTDGVLLGAWTNVGSAVNILDVGTGTGLIAFMLAQRAEEEVRITGIDINENAFEQANFNREKFFKKDSIDFRHISLSEFAGETKEKFEIIVSNPPYFSDSLRPVNNDRAEARHQMGLSLDHLFACAYNISTEHGRVSIIIPHDRRASAIDSALQREFFTKRICNVYPKPGKKPERIMIEFEKRYSGNPTEEDLTIENGERHCHTEKYIELTKDFYLKF
jgi:tRNA1Val (adenine37-N6)-methyltransferase